MNLLSTDELYYCDGAAAMQRKLVKKFLKYGKVQEAKMVLKTKLPTFKDKRFFDQGLYQLRENKKQEIRNGLHLFSNKIGPG